MRTKEKQKNVNKSKQVRGVKLSQLARTKLISPYNRRVKPVLAEQVEISSRKTGIMR